MPETHETRTISVNGDALVVRKPDLAYITLYIQSNGILLEDAVKEGASGSGANEETDQRTAIMVR